MILKQFIETVPYKGQCDNLKLSYNGMRVLAIHDQVDIPLLHILFLL